MICWTCGPLRCFNHFVPLQQIDKKEEAAQKTPSAAAAVIRIFLFIVGSGDRDGIGHELAAKQGADSDRRSF